MGGGVVKGRGGQEEMDDVLMVEAQGSQVTDLLPNSYLLNLWLLSVIPL